MLPVPLHGVTSKATLIVLNPGSYFHGSSLILLTSLVGHPRCNGADGTSAASTEGARWKGLVRISCSFTPRKDSTSAMGLLGSMLVFSQI